MKIRSVITAVSFLILLSGLYAGYHLIATLGQIEASPQQNLRPPPPPPSPPPGSGFGRRGPPPFGPMRQKRELVKRFDKDGDSRLNLEERTTAREFIRSEPQQGRGRRFGPRGIGRGEQQTLLEPGPLITPTEVSPIQDAPLYASDVIRTLFLKFETEDWEKELADFYKSDVEVPALLTVDGKVYPGVGVHFRGASSFFTVGEGSKRSFNLSLNFVKKDQRLEGYRTLNLLNSHTDPTFLRTVLYDQIARDYIPAPKANFVRVAINGRSWGVYVNAQQFNKDFIKEWFGTTKGARWKVPGSPRGGGGLEYIGENPADYKALYEIKSKDKPESWQALIRLCRVLNQTPVDRLEQALSPILNIDAVLKFLALENTLINNDGYWIRASDYNIYQEKDGRFHIIPHDANETFSLPGGPGFRRGPGQGGSGIELDPLVSIADPDKPLISKLLAVRSLRARYLSYVREIAEKWLDWNTLGPIVQKYHELIARDVAADTRKLDSTDAFTRSITEDVQGGGSGRFGGRGTISLKRFAEERRAYLLNHPQVKAAGQ